MRFAVQSGFIDYNSAQEIAGAAATAKRQHRAALELNRIPKLLHRMDIYRQTTNTLSCGADVVSFRWSEVDFETAMWTIPGEREPLEGVKHSHQGSKMRTLHLVPLSRQALTILKQIKRMSGN